MDDISSEPLSPKEYFLIGLVGDDYTFERHLPDMAATLPKNNISYTYARRTWPEKRLKQLYHQVVLKENENKGNLSLVEIASGHLSLAEDTSGRISIS